MTFRNRAAAIALLFTACGPPAPLTVHSPAQASSLTPEAPRRKPTPLPSRTPSTSPQSTAPTLEPDSVRAAVEPLLNTVVTDWNAPIALEIGAEPSCSNNECTWKVTVKTKDADQSIVGSFEVDDKSRQVWWIPNDGRDRRFSPTEYQNYRAQEETAKDTVCELPDVIRYCKQLRAASQPVNCIIFVSDPPKRLCEGALDFHDDDCFWQVYVGENQPTHLVRHATFLVAPDVRSVAAVSDAGCGLMSLAQWQRYRTQAERSRNRWVDCPVSVAP